jgi:hypothetical protein
MSNYSLNNKKSKSMSKTVITKLELSVPAGAIVEVADVLLENEIINQIVGSDADEDTVILEVQYEKEQREVIHEVEDIIAEYEEAQNQQENEDDE